MTSNFKLIKIEVSNYRTEDSFKFKYLQEIRFISSIRVTSYNLLSAKTISLPSASL